MGQTDNFGHGGPAGADQGVGRGGRGVGDNESDGHWVQGWVFVAYQDACSNCGEVVPEGELTDVDDDSVCPECWRKTYSYTARCRNAQEDAEFHAEARGDELREERNS